MEHLSYEEKLRELLFGLENKWFWGDPIVAFKNLNGTYKKNGEKHFSRVCMIGQEVMFLKWKRELDIR